MAAITTQRAWRLREEFRTQTKTRRQRDYAEDCRVEREAAMTARLRAGLRNGETTRRDAVSR